MPGLVTIPSAKPVSILGKDQAARITNTASSGTAYFGGDTVSSSSNDFSIAAGASRLVNGPRYAISSADLLAFVDERPTAAAVGTSVQQSRHFIHGPQPTSTGTSTTPTANRAQIGQVNIGSRCTLTGIRYLIGGTGGTDKAIVVLYDADGNVLANSAKAGTTVGTADTYQSLDFESAVEIVSPGKYFIGVIFNGTTARIRTALDDGVLSGTVNSAADFSAAPIAITPPTSAAVNGAPYASTY